MGRTVLRWAVGMLGFVLVVAGVGVAVGSSWVRGELGPDDSLRSAPQVLQSTGCRTLLIEVADAALDPGQVPDAQPLGIKPQSQLAVVADGTTDGWLVGLADGSQVSDRLLGTRYCLADDSQGSWTTRPVEIRPEDPDVPLGGLQGRWAQAASGESVILPIPSVGQTLVVAPIAEGELVQVEITGIYRLDGANELAFVGLIGGVMTVVIGLVLLVVSIFALRTRGRHETKAPSPAGSGVGAA